MMGYQHSFVDVPCFHFYLLKAFISALNSSTFRVKVERVKGIEPSSRPWEGHILPLNHTRTEWCVSWRFLFTRQVLPVGLAPSGTCLAIHYRH